MQHRCGTASGTAILKEHRLVNASIFCSLFKVVHCLFVSLTTDTLSKAIMELSSVQHFSNMVSVIGEVGWCWGYTPSGISRIWDSVVKSVTRSHDWFLIYGPEKEFLSGQQKWNIASLITAIFRNTNLDSTSHERKHIPKKISFKWPSIRKKKFRKIRFL